MKIKKLLFGGMIASAMSLGLISLSLAGSFSRETVLKADAAYPTTVAVNGVSVTSGTYYLNNGSVGDVDNYNYHYDSSTGVLDLNGFIGRKIVHSEGATDLKINLIGENTITGSNDDSTSMHLIKTNANLSIGGTGSLNLSYTKDSPGSNPVYGIQGGDESTVVLEDDASVYIDLTDAESQSYGIRSGLKFEQNDSAFLQIQVNSREGRSSYGLYTNGGYIKFNSDSTTRIIIGATNDSPGDFGICNNAYEGLATDNGDILFQGSGVVEVVNSGSGYCEGVYSQWRGATNQDGDIVLDGSDVKVQISYCAHGILNESDTHSPADYDVKILNGATLEIHSQYENFGHGIRSLRNGVLIQDSTYEYVGCGNPIDLSDNTGSGIYNESTLGFDVSGSSHVDMVVSENGFVASKYSKTCNFDLTGSGYVNYVKDDGTFPSLNIDDFCIKLGAGTRLSDYAYIIEHSTSNVDGALYYTSRIEDTGLRFEAYTCPDPALSSISINNHSLSAAKPYYHNGESEASADAEGYNAYYDYSKGILHLNGYNGGLIQLDDGNSDGLFTILLEGNDSTIEVNGSNYSPVRALDIRGHASIEITSERTNPKSLVINASNDKGAVSAIGTTYGYVRFTGYTDIYLSAECTDADAAHSVFGVEANYTGSGSGAVYIAGHSYLYATVSAVKAQNVSAGIYANGGRIEFDTKNESEIQIFADGMTEGYSYALYSSNSVQFKNYDRILMQWAQEGANGKPVYPSSSLDVVTNGAVNRDDASHLVKMKKGDWAHIDIENGRCNASQGNYILGETANLTAAAIDGLNFVRWEHTGLGTFEDEDQTNKNARFVVAEDETITATYDFVESGPFFDSKGTANEGIVVYKLRGTPTLVQIVESADHTNVVYSSNYLSGTTFTSGDFDNGEYCLCATYAGVYQLYSEPFNVTYGSAAHEYTLTFTKGDGSGDDYVVNHTYGGYALPAFNTTGLTAPEGQRFTKWSCNGLYDAGAVWMVNNDYTFTAIYEVIPTHAMSFVGDTGYVSGDMDDQEKREDQNFVLPEPTFIHEEHMQFAYWEVNSTHYNVGDTIPAIDDMIAYAVYEYVAQHTLSFAAGDGTGTMAEQVKYCDDNFVLPASTFTVPDNFEFSHWEVGGVEKQVGDTIPATADATATAIYTRIQVTLTFAAGDGTGSMDPVNYGKGLDYVLPDSTFTAPAHKQFKCWSIGGVEYAAGASYTVTGPVTITALYDDIVRNISFAAGEGTGTMAGTTCIDGQNFVLPASTFTAPAHQQFKCWSIGGVEYAVGASVQINADTTITAIFEDIMCNVTFSAGDGSGTMAGASVKEGGSYVLPASTFTAPEGKEFDGWMVGGVKHAAGEEITIDSDTTITAVFKDIPAPVNPDTPDQPDTPTTPGTPVTPTTPENPPKKGLSGGAIAGIVVASVVVVGVGGFALTWFVILKKSFADFLAIFKKK